MSVNFSSCHYSIHLYFIACVLATSSCASASNFPAEIAENYHCSEVANLSSDDDPAGSDPYYIYGFIVSAEPQDSVVFWCRNQNAGKTYKLIGHYTGTGSNSCSGVIIETRNHPRGLSLIEVKNGPLVGYENLTTGEAFSTDRFDGTIVRNFYDGIGETYFCIDDVWYMKRWD